MKTFSKAAAMAALLSVTACGAVSPPAPPPPPPPPSALSATDSTFVSKASEANLVAVALGKAAATNASSATVKTQAATIVTDYTVFQNRLSALAAAQGTVLPTAPSADDQKAIDSVTALKGAAFDKAFTSTIATNATSTLATLDTEGTTASTADLKAYARDTAATIRTHQDGVSSASTTKHTAAHKTRRTTHRRYH